MFRPSEISVVLILLILTGCAERPDESVVISDFGKHLDSLSVLKPEYEGCFFERKDVKPIIEEGKDEGWQIFIMNVLVRCKGKKPISDKLRFAYEYTIDLKCNNRPKWEWVSLSFVWKLPE